MVIKYSPISASLPDENNTWNEGFQSIKNTRKS